MPPHPNRPRASRRKSVRAKQGTTIDAAGRVRLPTGQWRTREWRAGQTIPGTSTADLEWTAAGPQPRAVDLVEPQR
jgi:hypothetical protein